jgi:hypothetical protein
MAGGAGGHRGAMGRRENAVESEFLNDITRQKKRKEVKKE